ncbi:MAG: ATPase [Bacteroidia bacterium]
MLIAESGATKTEWRYCQDNQVVNSFRGAGFNPNVIPREVLRADLEETVRVHMRRLRPQALYFYGSGIGGDSQRRIMQEVLEDFFPGVRIEIEHDLLAAARSTDKPEGIACIIGTGSNSCYYADGQIIRQLGGHGYLFGDEGSGADLGRHLIKGLLQDELPDAVRRFVEQQAGSSVYELKIAIHRDPKPSVRMARLAKYLDEIWHYPEVSEMIRSRLLAFLDTTVCRYEGYEHLPVNFFGSVAYFFQDFLTQACRMRDLRQVEITRDPIDRLVAYHLKQRLFS